MQRYDIRGAIERVLTRDPDKPITGMMIDGMSPVFHSMAEVDAFRTEHPKANGQLLTNDGYPINEENMRASEEDGTSCRT